MYPDDGPDGRRISWVEPWFDVVFAAAVGQVGRGLAAGVSVEPVLRFFFLQALLWWTWLGYLHYVTRLDPDAPRARLLTMLQVVGGVFLAANADDHLASLSTAGSVAAYGVMRLMLAVQFRVARDLPGHEDVARAWVRGLVPSGAVWLASAVVPVPARYALWGLAVGLELRLEVTAWRLTALSPLDARHLPERFGLFTLILLGEGLMAVTRGIQQQPSWHWAPLVSAIGSLAAIALVWWLYFVRLDATAPRSLATPRDLRWGLCWTYAHVPLFLGLALAAVLAEAAVREGRRATLDASRGLTLLCACAGSAVGLAGLGAASRHRACRLPPADVDPPVGSDEV